MNLVNSQGVKVYVVDIPAVAWADCTEAITAIQAGKQIGCPQSLGDIGGTRNVTEYKCLSSNESFKSLGSVSRGNMDIGLLFDPDDVAGQEALNEAWLANDRFIIGIELDNADTTLGVTGASGTIFWFEGGVSGVSIGIEQDSAVMYTATVEIASEVTECEAVAGSV